VANAPIISIAQLRLTQNEDVARLETVSEMEAFTEQGLDLLETSTPLSMSRKDNECSADCSEKLRSANLSQKGSSQSNKTAQFTKDQRFRANLGSERQKV